MFYTWGGFFLRGSVMNRVCFVSLVASFFSVLNLFCASAAVSDRDKLVSIDIVQKMDVREAFEAVYTQALGEGTLDKLSASFLNCLAYLREGQSRIRCSEFLEAFKFVIETLVMTSDFETRYAHNRPCACCEERFRILEEDMTEVFDFLDDRISRLESICGVVLGKR